MLSLIIVGKGKIVIFSDSAHLLVHLNFAKSGNLWFSGLLEILAVVQALAILLQVQQSLDIHALQWPYVLDTP